MKLTDWNWWKKEVVAWQFQGVVVGVWAIASVAIVVAFAFAEEIRSVGGGYGDFRPNEVSEAMSELCYRVYTPIGTGIAAYVAIMAARKGKGVTSQLMPRFWGGMCIAINSILASCVFVSLLLAIAKDPFTNEFDPMKHVPANPAPLHMRFTNRVREDCNRWAFALPFAIGFVFYSKPSGNQSSS